MNSLRGEIQKIVKHGIGCLDKSCTMCPETADVILHTLRLEISKMKTHTAKTPIGKAIENAHNGIIDDVIERCK